MPSDTAEIQAVFDRKCKLCGHGMVGRTFTLRTDDCKDCNHLAFAHMNGRCAAPRITGHPELGLCNCRKKP